MNRISTAALALVLALPAASFASTSTWEIDASHSTIGFSIRHLMVSNVRGEFGKVTGALTLDDKDPSKSTVQATIDATTVDTRDAKRDEHLRSPDFFDVAKYPTIAFKSKSVKKAGDRWSVLGDLTLHGVTKEVTLDASALSPQVKDPWGNTRTGLSAATKLSRKDFGLSYNKALDNGGVVLGDEVAISLELELTQKTAPAAAKM